MSNRALRAVERFARESGACMPDIERAIQQAVAEGKRFPAALHPRRPRAVVDLGAWVPEGDDEDDVWSIFVPDQPE